MIKLKTLTLFCLTTLICSGCVYTPIDIPALPESKPQPVCPKEVTPPTCPKLDMPEPIPKNLVIRIKDGKAVEVDVGGEQLLRQYVGTRKAVKQLWPG